MNASTYIGLDEVKAALNITAGDTTDDEALSSVLMSAARAVDAYCDRYFGTTDSTARMYQPVGALLNIHDLVTLTALEMDGSPNADTWTTLTTTSVLTLPANAATEMPARPYTTLRAKTSTAWPPETGWVRVTGIWGWPAVPQQIKDATLKQAVRLFVSKDVPLGVIGGADMMGALRLPSGLHPDARLLCDPFVRSNI